MKRQWISTAVFLLSTAVGVCELVVAQETWRVSVSSSGDQGNGDSGDYLYGQTLPSLSANGRFVAFISDASNLVMGDTNQATDVFVHDRQTGTTNRVSVDSSGAQANNYCGVPSISADGRFVAFYGLASNLVPGDSNNGGDAFVHDRDTGITTRVSVDSSGVQGNAWSSGGAVSADGRFVAFYSTANNLVPGDTNQVIDVFMHDRQTGMTE